MSGDEEEFQERSAELLREGTQNLSGHVRSRLTQARHAAVEEARRSRVLRQWLAWAPAGALAAALVIAVVMLTGQPAKQEFPAAVAPGAEHSAMDDLELLAGSESFELLEDLEFYDWLDAAPPADADIG
ncbi:MAG TPA: hypothetical protein VFR59_10740 [Steroidobacteraceae bacterium]|nr:hypothetical protein [Steroidobacteraceae bacterium]